MVFLCLSGLAVADGKMFWWNENVPPEIPYQRALILYKDGVETLILQSRFVVPEDTSERKPLGWVVPVPAVPDLASMQPIDMRGQFEHLDMITSPRVTVLSQVVFWLLLLGPVVLGVPLFFVLYVNYIFNFRCIPKSKRKLFERVFLFCLLCISVCFWIMPNLFRSTLGHDGVEVIKEEHVGIYDMKVIQSDDSKALAVWLQENQFVYDDKDTAVFDNYIASGWCFVVATIPPNPNNKTNDFIMEGLPAPLIMRFPHDAPVYPLMLTGTGGFDTEILIYLASDTYMKCDDRLVLRYAGEKRWNYYDRLLYVDTPEGFFTEENVECKYLMKYKGMLTPEAMSRDITFQSTSDDITHWERLFIWSKPRPVPRSL